MSKINVVCVSCGRVNFIDASLVGSSITCPCGTENMVKSKNSTNDESRLKSLYKKQGSSRLAGNKKDVIDKNIELLGKVEGLEGKLSSLKKEKEVLEKTIAESGGKGSAEVLDHLLSEVKSSKDAQADSFQFIKEEIQNLYKTITNVVMEVSSMKGEMRRVEDRIVELSSKDIATQSSKEIYDLKENIGDLKKQFSSLEAGLKEDSPSKVIASDIHKLRSELVDIKTDISEIHVDEDSDVKEELSLIRSDLLEVVKIRNDLKDMKEGLDSFQGLSSSSSDTSGLESSMVNIRKDLLAVINGIESLSANGMTVSASTSNSETSSAVSKKEPKMISSEPLTEAMPVDDGQKKSSTSEKAKRGSKKFKAMSSKLKNLKF